MRENNYKKDMKIANKIFIDNLDYFKQVLSCNEILSIEEIDNEVIKLLDVKSGIDFIMNIKNGGIKTLANRVQTSDKSWDTYTIRYKRKTGNETEFDKRIFDIENDYLYPHYTMQSYIKDGCVLNYDIIETKKLFEYIELNIENIKKRTAYDGNVFLIISFEEVKHLSIKEELLNG